MKKIFDFVKGFLNFLKNNLLLFLAAFFLLDSIIGVFFTPDPVDLTAKRIRSITIAIDLLWFAVLTGSYATSRIEKHLLNCIRLVDYKVDLIFDFIQKAIEEESKEEKEAADKEEKEVN